MAYSIPNSDLAHASSTDSLTQSFDASGGVSGQRVLLVFVASDDGDSSNIIPTVTFNGDSMTNEVAEHTAEGNNERIAAFYLANPDSVTGDVVVTFSASQNAISVGIALVSGVKEQAPEDSNGITPTTSSTSITSDVTTVTADAAIVAMAAIDDNQSMSISNATELSQEWGGTLRVSLVHEEGPTTPGSEDQTWSWSSGAERVAGVIALEIEDGLTGTSAITTPAPTMSATGSNGTSGTSAISIPVASMSASGSIAAIVTGTSAMSLPAPVMGGEGGVGDSWCSGFTRGDLPDSVFLSRSASSTLSELADDISQEDDDLTVGTNCVYNQNAGENRLSLGASGSIVLRVNMDDSDTGHLFHHANITNAQNIRLFVLSAGTLRLQANTDGAYTTQVDLDADAISSTSKELVIAAAWEPNPDTTGATDTTTYWLYVFDVAAGTVQIASNTGRLFGTIDYWVRFLASSSTGTNAFSGTCEEIAAYTGFYPPSTIHHWFVSGLDDPGYTGRERLEVPMPAASSTAADKDMPVSLVALAAGGIQQVDRRGLSPIINEVYNNQVIGDPEGGFPGSWAIYAPGQADLLLMLGYLKYRPVPNTANRLRCRLHVTLGEDVLDTKIAVYSMAQKPGQRGGGVVVAPPDPPEVHKTSTSTQSTAGMVRIDLGDTKIARDPHGWTYLAIAVSADTDITVHGWHVTPHSVEEDGGVSGFGFGAP